MKKIHRTYKFRLYPNKEQETFLAQHFGCVRWIYNHFLNERKEQYQQNEKSDNYNKQATTENTVGVVVRPRKRQTTMKTEAIHL